MYRPVDEARSHRSGKGLSAQTIATHFTGAGLTLGFKTKVLINRCCGLLCRFSERAVGSVIWRTEMMSPGIGKPPQLAVPADIEIPERKMSLIWKLRRDTNPDRSASDTIDYCDHICRLASRLRAIRR